MAELEEAWVQGERSGSVRPRRVLAVYARDEKHKGHADQEPTCEMSDPSQRAQNSFEKEA
jgi:hypothetical protein